jgi:hypothetical protein
MQNSDEGTGQKIQIFAERSEMMYIDERKFEHNDNTPATTDESSDLVSMETLGEFLMSKNYAQQESIEYFVSKRHCGVPYIY